MRTKGPLSWLLTYKQKAFGILIKSSGGIIFTVNATSWKPNGLFDRSVIFAHEDNHFDFR